MNTNWIRPLFLVAALYDGILGLIFLVSHESIFAFFEVTPPNHPAYVKFPALLLVIFSIMFLQVASDPVRNRGLILYGIGLKASYTGLAFWYQITMGIPSMWLPWAWFDLVFLGAFAFAYVSISPSRMPPMTGAGESSG